MAIVTNIALTAGGPAVHVTVDDTNVPPDMLPPVNITWVADTGITIAADATGFLFTADASLPTSTLTTAATYSGPQALNPVMGPTLTINVTAAVVEITGLQYTSP